MHRAPKSDSPRPTLPSLEDVEFTTLEWVQWYNYHRLLEPIGYVPPVEHEGAYYRRQQAPAELATLT